MDATALPFRDVDEVYREAQRRSPAFGKMSLQEFSRYANQATGTQAFDAGTSGKLGTLVKRASSAVDRFIRPVSRPLGQAAYDSLLPLIGEEAAQVGGTAFEAAPRAAAQMIPVFAAMSGGPVTAVGASLAGLGLAGTAAETYTATGSPAAGLVSAGATALMPGAARLGTRAATSVMEPVGNVIQSQLGRTAARAAERTGEYIGANVGAGLVGEAGSQGASVASGQGLRNPFTMENLVSQTVGQIPFGVFDVPQLVRGYKPAMVGGKMQPVPVGYKDLLDQAPIPSLTEWQRMQRAAALVEEAERIVRERRPVVARSVTSNPVPPPVVPPAAQTPPPPVTPPSTPKQAPPPPKVVPPSPPKTVPTVSPVVEMPTATAIGPNWGKDVVSKLPPSQAATIPGVTAADKAQYLQYSLEGNPLVMPLSAPKPGREVKDYHLKSREYLFAELQRKKNRTPAEEGFFKELEAEFGQGFLPLPMKVPAMRIKSTQEILTGSWHGAATAKAMDRGTSPADLERGWLTDKGFVAEEYDTPAMFTEEQLGNGFGLTGVEQTNALKPYGVQKTPLGELPTKGLMGRMRAVVPKAEMGVYEEAGLGQWLEAQPKVTPEALAKWMMENGPRVEVKQLRPGGPNGKMTEELASIDHELGTLGYGLSFSEDRRLTHIFTPEGEPRVPIGNTLDGTVIVPSDVRRLIQEARDLIGDGVLSDAQEADATIGKYGVEPKDVYNMEDPVELLVRVPVKEVDAQAYIGRKDDNLRGMKKKVPLWAGGHHGESGHNALGFVRGNVETLPDGKRVFHLFEVQSDWGGIDKVRRGANRGKFQTSDGQAFTTFAEAEAHNAKRHPLLVDYNRLVLKAALKYATDIGVDFLAVSDAETAMMTERHDAAAGMVRKAPLGEVMQSIGSWKNQEDLLSSNFGEDWRDGTYVSIDKNGVLVYYRIDKPEVYVNKYHQDFAKELASSGYGEKEGVYIPQEKGMRRNYDEILPQILEQLTGAKPVKLGFGNHVNAFEVADEMMPTLREGLVFKNPDGSFKTEITAHAFPMHRVRRMLAERHGFSLFSRDTIQAFIDEMGKEGASPEQQARAALAIRDVPILPGESVGDWLARRAGLDPRVNKPGSPDALMATTKRYFDGYFRAKGYTPQHAQFLTEFAQRVAARFGAILPRTRVMPAAEGSSNFYAKERIDKWNDFVALAGRNFVNRPQDVEVMGQMVALGHELFHGVQDRYATGVLPTELRKPFEDATAAAQDTTPQQREEIVRYLSERIGGKQAAGAHDYRSAAYADPNTGASEFLADVTGLLAMGSVTENGRLSAKDWALFGNRATSGWLKSIAQQLGETLRAVLEWFKRAFGIGQLDGATKSALGGIEQHMAKVMMDGQRADSAVAAFNEIAGKSFSDFTDFSTTVSRDQVHSLMNEVHQYDAGDLPTLPRMDLEEAMAALEKEHGPKSTMGKRMSWYHHGYPMTQLAARFKELKAAVDLGMSYNSVASRYIQETWGRYFLNAKGKVDQKRIKRLVKDGAPVNELFTKVALFQQTEEKQILGRQLRDFARLNVPKASEQDIQDVELSLQQFGEMNVDLARKRVEGFKDDVKGLLTSLMMSSDYSLKHKVAWDQASQIVEQVLNSPVPVPPGNTAKTMMLGFGHSSQAADAVGRAMEDGYAGHQKISRQLLGEDLMGKPWYFSEVRLGTWQVAYMDANGKRHLEGFKTEKEWRKRYEELSQNPSMKYVKAFNKADTNDIMKNLQPDMVEAYKQADEMLYKHALSQLEQSDPEAAAEFKETFQPGMGVTRMVTSPYMHPRKHVGGRERLNMAAGAVHYVDSTAYGLAKRFVKARQRGILRDPELRENPQLQQQARQYLRAITDPEGKEFTALKNLVFFHFMGLNPSFLFIEPTQLGLSHVPLLIRNGDGIGQAYDRVQRAARAVGSASVKRLLTRNGDVEPDASKLKHGITQDEVRDLLEQGRLQRVLETGFVSDMFGVEDQDFAMSRSTLTGTGALDSAEAVAKNSAYWLSQAARKFYGIAPRFNSRVAMLSAYEQARGRGTQHEEAVAQAITETKESMFGGGRANRPNFLHGWGKAQGVGGLMYSLQSYTANMYAFIGRLIHDSLKSSGLSEAERKSAKKALATMGATQFALGGALGMPMVATLLALWEQLFGESEPKRAARELAQRFGKLISDDEDFGNLFAEGAMGGAVNVLLPAADVGSRFQLGGLFGVNPYQGLSWKNFAGPAGSVVEAYGMAAQGLASGDVRGLVDALPSGLRGTAKMFRDQGMVRDNNENLLLELSDAERALTVLGFKPKRLSQYYERQSMGLRAEDIAKKEQQEFLSRMVDLVQEGRANEVQALLFQRQQEHPGEFDVREAVASIAVMLQKRRTPRADTFGGNRAAAQDLEQINQMFPRLQATGRPQEEYLERKQVERQVGPGMQGVGVPNLTTLRRMAMVQQVLEKNPQMMRQQAEMLVERLLNPRGYQQRFGQQP